MMLKQLTKVITAEEVTALKSLALVVFKETIEPRKQFIKKEKKALLPQNALLF